MTAANTSRWKKSSGTKTGKSLAFPEGRFLRNILFLFQTNQINQNKEFKMTDKKLEDENHHYWDL